MRLSHFITKAILTISTIFIMTAYVQANTITAELNKARLIKLDEPISHIVVGNPALITVNVIDPYTISLTGVLSGTTNLIILNADSEPQFSTDIKVPASSISINGLSIVRNKTDELGYTQQTMSCNDNNCTPTIAPGDTQPSLATSALNELREQGEENFPAEQE